MGGCLDESYYYLFTDFLCDVVFHEFGHFFFAKRSGILVREFAIGMGPKIFAHTGKDGTVYTIRILPLGGYVRMAGWGLKIQLRLKQVVLLV